MRILFVGGIQQKNAAARYYDVAPKLINGFIRNGHTVQHFADRDISRASNFLKSRKLGIKKCNVELIKRIDIFKPHLVVFKHADVIQPETLEEIRTRFPNVKMAQVNVDALFNPDNIERIKNKSGLVDANFITTYGKGLNRIKLNNVPVHYIPNPVDASIECHKAFEPEDCQSDLFLAYGSAPDGDPRKTIPENIKAKLPEVQFKLCIAGEGTGVWGAEYFNVLKNCASGLNLSRMQEKDRVAIDDDLYMYSSDRIAHYVGNGLLTFTDSAFHMDKLFTDKEMVFYTSEKDLQEKVKFYTENDKERQKIAKAGWAKAHTEFNEQKVAQFIEEICMKKELSAYAWPVEAI